MRTKCVHLKDDSNTNYLIKRHKMNKNKLKVVKTTKAQQAEGNEKIKALDAAIAQITDNFGKGSVMKLGERRAMDIESVSTGSLSLDVALGIGGLPKGRVIEIYGPESSGKTTLTLHCIAEQQKKGGVCAFVDAEHALDPTYAKALGVDVDNLLVSHYCWINNKTLLVSVRDQFLNWSYKKYDIILNTNINTKIKFYTDGHPMISPVNKEIFVTDTSYPDKNKNLHLFISDTSKLTLTKLKLFYTPVNYNGEIRCDLHPRWNCIGDKISVDICSNEKREMGIIYFDQQ